MELQLEVGKYYRTNHGDKVGPMEKRGWEDGYPWTADNVFNYFDDEGMGQNPGINIISEWTDTPDLTAITTPFGLLDEATQEALRAHGGPYEVWGDYGWCPCEPQWKDTVVYRVDPAPKVETVTHDMFMCADGGNLFYHNRDDALPVRVTFTRTNGVIDLDSYKVEAR